ncbi:phosphoribosylglycinamide formyltransferase [Montanilutibacter psychrotolerans]|uniref:Phosphoribosylglycinamide formyltransferase n=1 Tax=Montanilutibacter psychrotolerans TaxID=1327343 RepID=A0A3M8SZB8_9GAMM|nr:phosphoribosylglycinamide formyltransferase [Lysobacter psychrotolerans]RNF86055.1 phosphoribosylglycinamide formyltransferase [Lysobacter psychrotolerans]
MRRPYRIAVLASGRGSNLQAILDAIAQGSLDAVVAGVFSDKADAPALAKGRESGAVTASLSPRAFASRADYDESLFRLVDDVHPDLIVCAGYMRLVSEREVAARNGKMLNIHPSLLPAFKGLRTHQQALDAGVSWHGASVHFVSPELDGGPVIAQARVPVLPGDNADRLAQRVLEREHPLLLASLRLLAAGRIDLAGSQVRFDGRALHLPLQLDPDQRLVEQETTP